MSSLRDRLQTLLDSRKSKGRSILVTRETLAALITELDNWESRKQQHALALYKEATRTGQREILKLVKYVYYQDSLEWLTRIEGLIESLDAQKGSEDE